MTDEKNVKVKAKNIHNSKVLLTKHHALGSAESVKPCGSQQPLIARSIEDRPEEYEVIDGSARYNVLSVKK